jgi:hypothetical protein
MGRFQNNRDKKNPAMFWAWGGFCFAFAFVGAWLAGDGLLTIAFAGKPGSYKGKGKRKARQGANLGGLFCSRVF